jgi:sulfoxide reductase heme-binding subunit YedZ
MNHGPGRAGWAAGSGAVAADPAAEQPGAGFGHEGGMGGTPAALGGLSRSLTTATGYVGLVLLAATLLIGPASHLLWRATPLSLDIRRDLGIWAAIVSVVHVVVGFRLHEGGRVLGYFVAVETLAPRLDAFGLANYTGLAATGLLLLLVAISSDAAIGRLKSRLWKRLQRLSLAAFALVVAHAVLYGALGSRATLYPVLLIASVAAVLLVRIGSACAARTTSTRAAARPGPTGRRGGVSPSESPTT